MTRQTLAADVLDALVAAWKADATLSGYGNRLGVFDGPPLTNRSLEIELWVGATGFQDDETVISGARQWETFDLADNQGEVLDITCAISVENGSTDVATARRTAIDVFNAAASAIEGSSLSLGPEVYNATIVGSWQIRLGEWTSGVGVVLTFVVRVSGQV